MIDHTARRDWMSDQQWACACLIAEVFGGFHHLREFKACSDGVRVTLFQHDLATYDYDHLTQLVILAHIRCIRVSVCASGMRLELRAYARDPNATTMMKRHPALAEALSRYESRVPS